MKHRYHLWLVGALVLGSASVAQARTWLGINGNSYDTLALCFKAGNSTCTPEGRVISVPAVSAIPKTTAQTARLAAGAQPLYVIPVSQERRLTKRGSGRVLIDEVRACWTIGTNEFSQPGSNGGCGASQVLVNVIEH